MGEVEIVLGLESSSGFYHVWLSSGSLPQAQGLSLPFGKLQVNKVVTSLRGRSGRQGEVGSATCISTHIFSNESRSIVPKYLTCYLIN